MLYIGASETAYKLGLKVIFPTLKITSRKYANLAWQYSLRKNYTFRSAKLKLWNAASENGFYHGSSLYKESDKRAFLKKLNAAFDKKVLKTRGNVLKKAVKYWNTKWNIAKRFIKPKYLHWNY